MRQAKIDAELAAYYEAIAEPLTAQFTPTAFAMVGGIGPQMKVIDVGAGPGGLSVSAAEAGAHVLATDMSEAMVARASARLRPFPGCAASVMDGQALQTDDGAFDVALSMFGVGNFPDWQLGLRELARVTCQGGHGCVSVWSDPRMAGPVAILFGVLRSAFPEMKIPPVSGGAAQLASPEALITELSAAGFEDIKVRSVDARWTSPSVDAFLADLDRLYGHVPPYAGFGKAERRDLLPHFRDAAERFSLGGPVAVMAPGLVAAGRRG